MSRGLATLSAALLSQERQQAEREAAKKKRAFASLDEEDAGPKQAQPKQARTAAAQPRATNGARAPAAVAKHSGPPRTMIMLKFNSVRRPFSLSQAAITQCCLTPLLARAWLQMCMIGNCMLEAKVGVQRGVEPSAQHMRQNECLLKCTALWHAMKVWETLTAQEQAQA